MSWRLAYSLATLRDEVWTLAPGTRVDTIDDTPQLDSDHDDNAAGVVCAIDVFAATRAGVPTGLDLNALAEAIRGSGHPELKYVIWQRKIATRGSGFAWRTYTGAAHNDHVHISVGTGPDGRSRPPYDSRQPWGIIPDALTWHERIINGMKQLNLSTVTSDPASFVRDPAVKVLQGCLLAHGYGPDGLVGSDGRPDGVAGTATKDATGKFQTAHGTGKPSSPTTPDYIVGEGTWTALVGDPS